MQNFSRVMLREHAPIICSLLTPFHFPRPLSKCCIDLDWHKFMVVPIYTHFFYKQQVYKQVTSQVSEPISNGGSLRTHSILSISKWHDFRFWSMILAFEFDDFLVKFSKNLALRAIFQWQFIIFFTVFNSNIISCMFQNTLHWL